MRYYALTEQVPLNLNTYLTAGQGVPVLRPSRSHELQLRTEVRCHGVSHRTGESDGRTDKTLRFVLGVLGRLGYGYRPIDGDVAYGLHDPTGPADFELVNCANLA